MKLQPINWLGRHLANYLSKQRRQTISPATSRPELVASSIRKGDVLLVEGSSRFSSAIKYLTQSTWSHSALCVTDSFSVDSKDKKVAEDIILLEADIIEGVRLLPLSECANYHTRICRPVGLSFEEIDQLVEYAKTRLGDQYDTKNIIDLARYLIQEPPVPAHWRRGMLALGSGEPTRAICSSLVAQAFHSVHYPILPRIELVNSNQHGSEQEVKEIVHIRHYSLFTPRDFDISPYFKIIKPNIENGFDPHSQQWSETS